MQPSLIQAGDGTRPRHDGLVPPRPVNPPR